MRSKIASDRRPVRDLQRRGRGRSGRPRGRPRSSSSRASSSRYSSSRPPTHSPLRGMGECTLPARRRRSDASCLGGRCAQAQSSGCQSCSQHPLLHAAHNLHSSGPLSHPPRLPTTLELPVLPCHQWLKRFGSGVQINLRNFPWGPRFMAHYLGAGRFCPMQLRPVRLKRLRRRARK